MGTMEKSSQQTEDKLVDRKMKEFAEYLVRESSKYVSWQAAPKSGLICNFDEMGFWKVEKRDKISRENKHIQGRKGRKQKSRQVSLRNWDDSD
jgi:hypothetical protein